MSEQIKIAPRTVNSEGEKELKIMNFPKLVALIYFVTALLLSGCSSTSKSEKEDLKALAKKDLVFLKKFLQENHPAALNKHDLNFKKWSKKGFEKASKKLKQISNQNDHYYLLSNYLKGFSGGHLWLVKGNELESSSYWPGFSVWYLSGKYRVMISANLLKQFYPKLSELSQWSETTLPQTGSELLSCDDQSPKQLIHHRRNPLGDSTEVDDLGLRLGETRVLFHDYGNSSWNRPQTCIFEYKGKKRTIRLDWRKLSTNTERVVYAESNLGHTGHGYEVQKFGEHSLWVTLPTFDPQAIESVGFKTLLRSLKEEKKKKPPLIVFDLRGNGGGSAYQFNNTLRSVFSKEVVDAVNKCKNDGYEIYRRVTKANLDYIRQRFDVEQNKEIRSYFLIMKKAFLKAKKNGKAYVGISPEKINKPYQKWTKDNDLKKGNCNLSKSLLLNQPRIVAVFDFHCASACIMFLDLLAQFKNAIFLGQPSRQRDIYLEMIQTELPSGLAKLHYPLLYQRNPNLRQFYHPRFWYNVTMIPDQDMQEAISKTLKKGFKIKNF